MSRGNEMSGRLQEMALPTAFEYIEPYRQKFLTQHPHVDRNVFLMMPFSTPTSEVIFENVAKELEHHGLITLRADGKAFSPVLWWNVVTYMLGSSYGIVIYEASGKVPFNPNVSIEAGFMLALDRPVLFLANEKLRGLPVDFAGHIFKTYKSDPDKLGGSARDAVRDWIEHDLSYYDYGKKKLVLFVSLGGTCRCVMSKAILADLADKKKISGLAVEAAAVADPHHATISPSALRAIQETGRERWIEKHRPRKLCAYLQDRADLIIALTDTALARRAEGLDKVVTDRELFGVTVPNPYPDKQDDESLKKYREVRDQLDYVINEKFDAILELANARPTV
jgi:protein-tyrosine-phosphatase